MAAPVGEVITPSRAILAGRGCLRAASNRPLGQQAGLELLKGSLQRPGARLFKMLDDQLELALSSYQRHRQRRRI